MRRPLAQPIPFARYRLIERIGHGGMATVYRAQLAGPGGFERDVVVKMLLPTLGDNPAFVDMFINEAKLSALLHHPNIAQVHELDVAQGTVFLAMEFIDGIDLSDLVLTLARRGESMPVGAACFLIRELCDGLAYAHGATDPAGRPLGIVHRDVSPANIMLGRDGSVKLLDFGIAKLLAEGPRERTETGTLKGKYGYMAPEQVAGRSLDHRTDLFAVGIVLHELLTGRRLFRTDTDFKTLRQVTEAEILPPSQHNQDVPAALDAIVLRALTRDVSARFQSAQDMSEALDGLTEVPRWSRHKFAAWIGLHCERPPSVRARLVTEEAVHPTPVAPAPGAPGRWQPIAVVAAAVALGAVGLVTLVRRPLPLAAAPAPQATRPPPKLAATEIERTSAGARAAPDREQVTLTIESVPSGATVSLRGAHVPLGSTPLIWKTNRRPVSATLSIERPGYRSAQLVTDLDRDARLVVTLTPHRPPPTAHSPSPAPDTHAPEVDLKQGGLVDPFQGARP
ncbi:MAG TPA: serine/threonine-protein kinase [Polyangia bacterium]|nr:serine/threonine-protein kinase [Polyangia bacterium]